MALLPVTRKTRRAGVLGVAGLSVVLAGAILARGQGEAHRPGPAGVKAPVAEVLHCPLAFAGVHLQKDRPSNVQVAYHYCKPLNDDVSQCLLYDGTGPDARLIGVEYLVSDEVFRTMPAEEQAYWHDHEYEVDAGLIRSLTQRGAEEKQTLAKVRTLHGKIFHTWVAGKTYPEGPAKLFWAATGKAPFVVTPGAATPPELKQGENPHQP
ncbi:MAG: DUF1264 domain-containing protein [Isosphaeraceae bacterium]|nr:DUF1264 domain-containing protein [Isosphaeraceae bacterium]